MEIEYKVGSTNKATDAFSRRDEELQLGAISAPYLAGWEEIQKEIKEDPRLQKIKGQLEKGEVLKQPYKVIGGRLFYRGRICVPTSSSWVTKLEEFYTTPAGGHSGVLRSYKRLAANVYWPNMFKTVQDFVASCLVCRKSKYEALLSAGLLQTLSSASVGRCVHRFHRWASKVLWGRLFNGAGGPAHGIWAFYFAKTSLYNKNCS